MIPNRMLRISDFISNSTYERDNIARVRVVRFLPRSGENNTARARTEHKNDCQNYCISLNDRRPIPPMTGTVVSLSGAIW